MKLLEKGTQDVVEKEKEKLQNMKA